MRNGTLTRVLKILRKLEGRGSVTLAQLAKQHGVHQRTIRRDLYALEEAGVPLCHSAETGDGLSQSRWWMVTR